MLEPPPAASRGCTGRELKSVSAAGTPARCFGVEHRRPSWHSTPSASLPSSTYSVQRTLIHHATNRGELDSKCWPCMVRFACSPGHTQRGWLTNIPLTGIWRGLLGGGGAKAQSLKDHWQSARQRREKRPQGKGTGPSPHSENHRCSRVALAVGFLTEHEPSSLLASGCWEPCG